MNIKRVETDFEEDFEPWGEMVRHEWNELYRAGFLQPIASERFGIRHAGSGLVDWEFCPKFLMDKPMRTFDGPIGKEEAEKLLSP